jgi:hypothetical protein
MIENEIFWRLGECQTYSKWQTIGGHPSRCIEGKRLAGPASPLRGAVSKAAGCGNLE